MQVVGDTPVRRQLDRDPVRVRCRLGRPASASRWARVDQAGWNRSTAGSAMASSARKPAVRAVDLALDRRERDRRAQRRRHPHQGAVQLAQRLRVRRPGAVRRLDRRLVLEPARPTVSRARVAATPRRGRSALRPSASRPARRGGRSGRRGSRRAGLRASDKAHQRGQPEHFWLVGQQVGQQPEPGAVPPPTAFRSARPAESAASRSHMRRRPLRAPRAAVRPGRRGRAARTECPHRGCVSWLAPGVGPWRRVRPRRPRRPRPRRRRAPSAASAACGCSSRWRDVRRPASARAAGRVSQVSRRLRLRS